MIAELPPAPYERLTYTPLITYDRDGIRATLSTRSDGMIAWYVTRNLEWSETSACSTRALAVAAVEQAIRDHAITPSRGDRAADTGANP